jgi:hypothetical protein
MKEGPAMTVHSGQVRARTREWARRFLALCICLTAWVAVARSASASSLDPTKRAGFRGDWVNHHQWFVEEDRPWPSRHLDETALMRTADKLAAARLGDETLFAGHSSAGQGVYYEVEEMIGSLPRGRRCVLASCFSGVGKRETRIGGTTGRRYVQWNESFAEQASRGMPGQDFIAFNGRLMEVEGKDGKLRYYVESRGGTKYYDGDISDARMLGRHNSASVWRDGKRVGSFDMDEFATIFDPEKVEFMYDDKPPPGATRAKEAARLSVKGRGAAVGGFVGGLIANYAATYAGQSVAGDAGALGAAFGAGTLMGRMGGASWRLSAGSAGAGVATGFLTSYALSAAGVENRWVHTGAGIASGSLVEGAIAYGTWTTAAGGTAAGAAGTAMMTAGLYGVLAAEVVYHAGQWYEIYDLNRMAASGEPAAQQALNEITFGGSVLMPPYMPQTYLIYGAYSWVTRPGEVLGDLWTHGL